MKNIHLLTYFGPFRDIQKILKNLTLKYVLKLYVYTITLWAVIYIIKNGWLKVLQM